MTTGKIILIACGTFNPITPMHLRMFEIARDHIHLNGEEEVIGGIISPVHDDYKKQDLVPAQYRLAMVKLGLQTSSWIRLSDWESQQKGWSRTRVVLQHHQNSINSYIKDKKKNNNYIPTWLPEAVKELKSVKVRLLCGADVVQSFSVPGLWKDEDLEAILSQHGIVVITRASVDLEKIVFESDLLARHQKNITIVHNWAVNEMSSTICRRFIRRGLSVKYVMDDYVAEYIYRNRLYQSSTDSKPLLTPNHNSAMLITPDENLDNYVLKRNQRNTAGTPDDYDEESMDETDAKQGSTTEPSTPKLGDDETDLTDTTETRPSRTFLNRPGGAVKINRGDTIVKRNSGSIGGGGSSGVTPVKKVKRRRLR